MKWLIASDLHGSAYWTDRLMDFWDRSGADRALLLGDLLYHGPRNDLPRDYAPKRVIERLNERKDRLYAVRGNCEAEVDQMVLHFPVLADSLLMPVGDRLMFVTHGHLFNENLLPPHSRGDLLLHGPTHVPVCRDLGEMVYLNPGSVSIPKENSAHACMLLQGTLFTWYDLETGLPFKSWDAAQSSPAD